MSDASSRSSELTDPPATEMLDALSRLAAAGQETDGQPAFSDQTWVELRRGTARLFTLPGNNTDHHDGDNDGDNTVLLGAASLSGAGTESEPLLIEMLIHPNHRGRGHGTGLVQELRSHLTEHHPDAALSAWAHGDHPAARHLAATTGLTPARELWKMALPLSTPHPTATSARWDDTAPEGITVREFVPGQDDSAWLATNAAAFADHPEQGRLTQEDLRERQGEDWFSAAGFFVAEDPRLEGAFAGFHWTKIPVGSTDGEVYAVGVHPQAQGSGLGRVLTARGLNHLAEQNLERIVLYVDADNAPAVALYRSLGFTIDETDVLFVGAVTSTV